MGKIFILKGADFSAHKVGDVNIDSPIPDEPEVLYDVVYRATDFDESWIKTEQSAYYNDTGKLEANAGMVCVLIPLKTYKRIVISGNVASKMSGNYTLTPNTGYQNSVSIFLKGEELTNDNVVSVDNTAINSGGVIKNNRINVPYGQEIDINIPEGAKYLWCNTGMLYNAATKTLTYSCQPEYVKLYVNSDLTTEQT